jgi:TonB family protein
MRKAIFVRTLPCCFGILCLAALGLICLPALAQNAAPAAAPLPTQATAPDNAAPAAAMPSEPKELMLLAAKTNGLTGDDVKPWHLKASWKMLDKKGSITDQGSYEEFYVRPTKFKRIFAGKAFTQTEYGTEKGIMVSGSKDPLQDPLVQIHNEFADPMMRPDSIQRTSFKLKQREVGNMMFDCLTPITTAEVPYEVTWCLDTGKSILRISAPPQGAQIVHNSIVRFQGRYIAKELQFVYQSNTILIANLDSIELLTSLDETLFQAPPDATPMRLDVNVSGAMMSGLLLKSVPPAYSRNARNFGITGTVVLQATISKEGHIEDLYVISGPRELQQAAMDSVKQWVYKPYLIDGEPVEVQTQINISFAMGQ